MNLKELFTEDRGVSPVIGVILMVAITVILAAVIGAFVLGLGDQASQSAPQSSIGFSFDGNDRVALSHDGGDNLQSQNIEVTVGGERIYNSTNRDNLEDFDLVTTQNRNDWDGETIRTGDEIDVTLTDESSGETVRVVWNNPAGGSSNTIADRRWP